MASPSCDQSATTLSTWPGVFPVCSSCNSCSHASRDPCATTCTRPSGRLAAYPVRPSSNARERVHQRKPTPCTRPCTHAVSRMSGPDIGYFKGDLGARFQGAPDRTHLVDRALDNRRHARLLGVVQARQVDLESFLQQRVDLLVSVGVPRNPDGGLVVVAEATGQRMVAGHPAARGERDLQQLTGSEDAVDVLGADEYLRAPRAVAGIAARAGAFHPQFGHGLFLP